MHQARRRLGACALLALGWLHVAASRADAICSTSICVPFVPPITGACQIASSQTIDDGCTLNFGSSAVTVARPAVVATGSTGHSFTMIAATLDIRGIVRARGGTLTLFTTGNLSTSSTSNAPGKIDVEEGGTAIVWGLGAVTLDGSDVSADAGGALDGGSVIVAGASVSTSSPIHANGSGGSGGDVRVVSTGAIGIDGNVTVNAASATAARSGGTISLEAGGNLIVAKALQAKGAHDGDGGELKLEAGGVATLGGNYSVDGVGGNSFATGGRIDVKAGSATVTGSWTGTANAAAQGGDFRIETTTGSLLLASGSLLNVNGGGNGGGIGGSIELLAATDATINGNVTANAGGADSSGGDIVVRAPGTISVGGTIDARSTANNGERDGSIFLGPACDVVVTGTLKTRDAAGGGRVTVHYYDTFDASGATLRADDSVDGQGGNYVICGCVDANQDEECDAPEACTSSAVTSGATILPSLVSEVGLGASCS